MRAENGPSIEPTVPLMKAEEFVERFGNARTELVRGVVRWGPFGADSSVPSDGPLLKAEEFMERYGNARTELVDGVVRWGPLSLSPGSRGFVALGWPASGGGRGTPGKVVDHFRAGAVVVIVLDPATRSATVYRPDAPAMTHRVGDTLSGPDVQPRFAVEVARLFE